MILKRSVILLLHIVYWLAYLMIVLLFVLAARHATVGETGWVNMGRLFFSAPLSLAAVYPAFLSFYAFYWLLFPRFLQRKLFGQLILVGLGICCLLGLGFAMLEVRKSLVSGQLPAGPYLVIAIVIGIISLVHGIVGLVTRGFIAWYEDIRLKTQLRQKQEETELALLKSQLHPHFLFNTLHNIDVLIGKDPELASLYLNKLSDILRFVLYETKTGLIPLERELVYIEKYIDLQRIRTSNPNYVRYEVEGEVGALSIEPMLFMPFIENAFKHAESRKKEDAIHIRFQIGHDKIIFDCENRFYPTVEEKGQGGLGNELIRKRLGLLYPNRHQLDLGASGDISKVNLVLHGHPA